MNDIERLKSTDPKGLTRAFDGLIQPALAERLAASDRFAGRLLGAAFGLPEAGGDPNAPLVKALTLNLEGLGKLISRTGAVWHANTIIRVVDGGAVRSLKAKIGEDAYLEAVAGRFLAPGLSVLTTAESPSGDAKDDPGGDDLATAVAADGSACWAAWRRRQPERVARRLALLEADAPCSEAHETFGPRIVEWLLSRS